jgi:phosphatidylethanolamine/phosphatidyl-N-methylethanolamine N-methyltransferase
VPANIENIFLGQGAWVQGKLSLMQSGNGNQRRIYGPGVLDASRFNYDDRVCPGDQGLNAISWQAPPTSTDDTFLVDGIVITDPNHGPIGGVVNGTLNNMKTLGWNGLNGGFGIGTNTKVSNVFVRSSDDSLMVWGDNFTVTKAYACWAPVYDLVFGAVFDRGHRAAIAAAEQVGGRILEVGVGTGITLPGYSPENRITGIDLSEAMLRKAQQRVAELSLTNVEKLEVMDAEHLTFPNASFDVVVANHVISTVPHPEVALDECARMLRSGGEMILLSRVGADAGFRHLVEQLAQPLVRRLGWRTEFPWGRLARWAKGRTDVRLIERRPMPPFGHFWLLRFVKCEQEPGT